jgi:hypothetical protein
MYKTISLLLLSSAILCGCASQRISTEDPVNKALKLCGLGIDAKSADAYKAAIDFANKKGTASFGSEVSEAIETQMGVLLKQANLKSDTGLKTAVEEMRGTRECVIRQVEMLRPATKSDLLEQCRLDVQRKISPPGTTTYGVLRNWNQFTGNLSSAEIVTMTGLFDTQGTSSFPLKAQCDLRGGKFNEAVIQRTAD